MGLCACTSVAQKDAAVSLVPRPSSYAETAGNFLLNSKSDIAIIAGEHSDEVRRTVAEYLAVILRGSTGFGVEILDTEESPGKGDIILSLAGLSDTMNIDGESEAYTISIETTNITLTANEPEGLFRGVQTLRQLFGGAVEKRQVVPDKTWSIPCGEIRDTPAYEYRGLMLDVARHFFPKEIIMRQIDLAASYKINKLHLHLSDDQGWRIQIQSRPALTEIGSLGAVNGDPGGYYTQEDFADIVAYAAERYIEVIPEIDMPGHVNAALVSIPELNKDGKAASPRTDIQVGYSSFQCRSEVTYAFIDDVIREIAAISPSTYFHIGGDEANSTSREDYYYFFGRVSEIAKKYGKTTIGWNPYERSEGVFGDAVLQNWDGSFGSSAIADRKGMRVILSPPGAYIDQKYNASSPVGLRWRGFVPLKRSYEWYPRQISPESKLLGIESTLWAETVVTQEHMDYLLYPRLMANAEIGWTGDEVQEGVLRDFDEFMDRLPAQLERLDALGVQYSKNYK
jgi:N-acetyl-beta-hexosaminidase